MNNFFPRLEPHVLDNIARTVFAQLHLIHQAQVKNSFPLLRLEPNVLNNIIRTMNIDLQIALSFVSKRTKALIESQNIQAAQCRFDFSSVLHIIFRVNEYNLNWIFYRRNRSMVLDTPGSAEFYATPVDYRRFERHRKNGWAKAGYKLRDWLEHLLSVMHLPNINVLGLYNNHFVFDEIAKLLNGYQVSQCRTYLFFPEESAIKAATYFPLVKNFHLLRPHLENQNAFREILIRNFDQFCFGDVFGEPSQLKLNRLLIANATDIVIHKANLSEKDLFKFVKLWMEGGNPRLRYMELEYSRNIQVNLVLERLQCQKLPPDEERLFQRQPCCVIDRKTTIKGGYEFSRRKDCVRATLHFGHNMETNRLQFVVWD